MSCSSIRGLVHVVEGEGGRRHKDCKNGIRTSLAGCEKDNNAMIKVDTVTLLRLS